MRFIVIALLFALAPACSFSQVQVSAEYLRGDSLYKQKKYEEARPIFESLLHEEKNDSLHIEIEVRLGYILSAANLIDSSIYYLRAAIAECISKKIYFRLSRTYNGIGNQFMVKRNFREAMPYYREGLKAADNADDSVRVYLSMIVLNLKQRKYDDAYSIVNNELSRCKGNSVPYRDFYVYQSKGNFFLSKLNFDSALFFLKKAVNENIDPRLKANVFNDIAETYRGMKNNAMAFSYQDSAAIINKDPEERSGDNLIPFYDTYAKLYSESGDFRQALMYADSARHLSDSLFDADKNNATIDADAKYNNQKALAEKALAEKETSISQRNFVIALFCLGLAGLIAFVSFRIARVRKKANHALVLQRQQVQQLADELAVANETKARLFSTISHDLRSPVSSLYARLRLSELNSSSSQSMEMSNHTVQLLDTLEELLVWSKSQMEGFVLQPVRISAEELFSELEKFYNSPAQIKNISFTNEITKGLKVKTDENILKAILRNAISNAIAHTAPGMSITLLAAPAEENGVIIAVKNPCTEESFNEFKKNFSNTKIESQTSGLGIVLMKEFAQKINARIEISYVKSEAVLSLKL